jgi:hypothetical protein
MKNYYPESGEVGPDIREFKPEIGSIRNVILNLNNSAGLAKLKITTTCVGN